MIRPSQPVILQWDEWISVCTSPFLIKGEPLRQRTCFPASGQRSWMRRVLEANLKLYWGKPTILCTYIPEPPDIRGTAAAHWAIPTKLPLSVYDRHATTAREIRELGSLTVQLTPMGWHCAKTWFPGITTLKIRKWFCTATEMFSLLYTDIVERGGYKLT